MQLIGSIGYAAILALVAGACATTTPSRKSAAPAAESTKYDFKREGKIPPVDDRRTEVDVEEMAVAPESVEVTEAEAPPVDSTRVAATADTLVDGFRVQVFASSDREVAENARLAAEQRLKMRAYLDLEGGVYKVRVGDFATRAEAEQSLKAVRADFYPDAWIVASKVVVPRTGNR